MWRRFPKICLAISVSIYIGLL